MGAVELAAQLLRIAHGLQGPLGGLLLRSISAAAWSSRWARSSAAMAPRAGNQRTRRTTCSQNWENGVDMGRLLSAGSGVADGQQVALGVVGPAEQVEG